MTNPKNSILELSVTAVELALAFDDLLDESARKGAALIEAMSDDEIERLISQNGEIPSSLESLVTTSKVLWRGFLESFSSLRPVTDAALSDDSSGSGHVGVKIDLMTILGDQLEKHGIAWASGPIRVEAAYSDAETISSLRISVGVKNPSLSERRPILFSLLDRNGAVEAVSLNSERTSVTLQEPTLSGPFKELELQISAEVDHST